MGTVFLRVNLMDRVECHVCKKVFNLVNCFQCPLLGQSLAMLFLHLPVSARYVMPDLPPPETDRRMV